MRCDFLKRCWPVSVLLLIFMAISACTPMATEESPQIDGELAYGYAGENVAFGNRYAGSEALRKSADWIVKTLRSVPGDCQVDVVEFEAKTPVSAKDTVFRNLVATWNGPGEDYVILGAHYDTKRFFSGMKFDGANDGASGVGVLLAVQKTLSELEKLPIQMMQKIIFKL